MTRLEYAKICKTCKNHDFDPKNGVICSITSKIANFEGKCNNLQISQEAFEKQLSKVRAARITGDMSDEADKGNAGMDIAIGGLICIVGIGLTMSNSGVIFYGAILYGGFRFIGGLTRL